MESDGVGQLRIVSGIYWDQDQKIGIFTKPCWELIFVAELDLCFGGGARLCFWGRTGCDA